MLSRPWARRAVVRLLSCPARARRRAVALRLAPLEDRLVPATFRWINPAGGDFATAANWEDQAGNPGVPTDTDDALILTPGITVTSAGTNAVRNLTSVASLDVPAGSLTAAAASLTGPVDVAGGSLILKGLSTASTVTLSAGTLGGAGTLTVTGNMDWTGGTVAAGLHVAAGATLDIGGTAPEALDNATLTNDGTVTWDGTGGLEFRHNAAVRNNGLFRDMADHAATFTGTAGEAAAFHNPGQYGKSAGAGVSDLGVPFDNTGTLDADSGTLQLSAGSPQFNEFGFLTAGVWEVGAGATLDAPGTTLFVNGADVTLSGPGATFTPLSDLEFNDGSFTLTNGANLTTGDFLTNLGRLTIGPGSTLGVTGFSLGTSGNTVGRLTFQVAGRPGSGQFGQLIDASVTDLTGGTLGLTLLPGADTVSGDVYTLISSTEIDGTLGSILQDGAGNATPFNVTVEATELTATAVQSVTDLAVATVNAPAAPAAPGDDVTVSWTVKNNAAVDTSVTDWTDAVYVSASATFDDTAVKVGTVAHTGGLAAGATYDGSWTGQVPGLLPGDYFVYVVADSDTVVPDADRADNAAAASATFTVTDLSGSQVLTLGTQANGTVAAGQDAWYRVDAPGGTPLRVTATFAAAGAGELSVDYRQYPQPGTALGSAADPTTAVEQVVLTATQTGTYYLHVHGTAAGTFSLLADTPSFGITRLVNATGSNVGTATLTIHGVGFTPNAKVSLVRGSVIRAATSVLYVGPDTVFATFNLKSLAAGSYDVKVIDSTHTDTVAGGYTVTTAAAGFLVYHITPPATAPVGQEAVATIEVTNTGGTDLPAPLLLLSAPGFNVTFRLPEEPKPGQSDLVGQLYFLPTSTDAPAGVIPPGYHGTIRVLVTRAFGTGPINLLLEQVNAGKPIPWNLFKFELRPTGMPADAWNAIWSNFRATVGGTSDSYATALRTAATYLAAVGTPVRDASDLLGYLLEQADAPLPGTTLYEATDASFPAAGLPLAFTRGFLQSVDGHYRLGRLGRGWVDNWDISLGAESGGPPTNSFGNVILHAAGTDREFDPTDGTNTTYRPTDGGDDVLSFDGTRFVLAGANGTGIGFRPDGQLDYVQDAGGTRVTAGYDATGHLVSLTHSDGRALTFTWNKAGRIATVTDPAGRVTRFAYSGQHLVSATGPAGVEKYGYTGTPVARANALTSVTTPDKVKTTFKYDARGRLTGQTRTGGPAVTYAYGAGGGVTVTDTAGGKYTLLPDRNGRVAAVRENTGSGVRAVYDADGLPTRFETAAGQVWTVARDADGRVTAATDPLGQTVRYAFAGNADVVSAFTDARGNTTGFQSDFAGRTQSVTYPGTGGTDSYVHDPAGTLVETVNRGGDPVVFEPDPDGQVVRRVFADGTATTYAYDAHGNLTAATDATGTTTLAYVNDRLTKVTYPDGRFLQFTYDAAGRRAASVDQDGFTTKYAYDTAGRLAKLLDGTGAVLVKYTYDKAGRPSRKDDANGTFATYAYDAAGRLQTLVNHAPGGAVNSQFDYTYDPAGRVATMTTAGVTTTYGYDLTGQLTSVVTPTRAITYTYDAAGNRTSVTDNGVTTTYTVNELNEVTAAGATTFTYDADGNRQTMTDAAGTTTYAWDDLNRLTGVTSPADTLAYTYDPLGGLWQTTDNGQTTTNLNDPFGLGTVAAQYGPGGLIAHYLSGLGLEGRVDAAGGKAFYDFDQLGNVVGLTNAAGAYVNKYKYLPFGETTTVLSGVADNPFTFAGQWGVSADAGGLLNLRARRYDPAAGGFLSDDPFGFGGRDFNVRRYAANSPTNATDPSGLLSGFAGYSGSLIPWFPGPSFTGGISADFDSCSWYWTIGGGQSSGGATLISLSSGNISQGTAIDVHASLGTPGYAATGHAYIEGNIYGDSSQGAYWSEDFGYKVGPTSAGVDIIGYIYGGEIPGCWEEKLKKAKKRKPHPDLKFNSPGLSIVPGTTPVRLN